MAKIRLAIFDCDGTIYDGKLGPEGDLRGLQRVYKELGIKTKLPTKKELMKRMGFPYPDFFKGLIPEEVFLKAYKKAYNYSVDEAAKLILAKKGKLMPGTMAALKKLKKKGLKLGIATNGRTKYLNAVVKAHKLDKIADMHLSFEQVKGDKGDIIFAIMKKLKAKPEETIMIGDRKSDLEAAKKAGCHAIALTNGYGSRKELKGATNIAANMKEACEIIWKLG